jgi:hypothetical protein
MGTKLQIAFSFLFSTRLPSTMTVNKKEKACLIILAKNSQIRECLLG